MGESFCTNCGVRLLGAGKYCANCGWAISQDDSPAREDADGTGSTSRDDAVGAAPPTRSHSLSASSRESAGASARAVSNEVRRRWLLAGACVLAVMVAAGVVWAFLPGLRGRGSPSDLGARYGTVDDALTAALDDLKGQSGTENIIEGSGYVLYLSVDGSTPDWWSNDDGDWVWSVAEDDSRLASYMFAMDPDDWPEEEKLEAAQHMLDSLELSGDYTLDDAMPTFRIREIVWAEGADPNYSGMTFYTCRIGETWYLATMY